MVTQDLPADDVGLAASQASHDGLQIAVNDAVLAVVGNSALVQAVSDASLSDDDLGGILGVAVHNVSADSTSHAADASLQDDNVRTLNAVALQLLQSLAAHGSVTLHDPAGDLGVAFPSGILNDNTVLNGISLSCCNTDTLVVVDFFDGDLCVFLSDVVETGLGRALGHVNDSLLAQLVSCPCNATAVVAVGSGAEGCLAKLFLQSCAGQVVISHLGNISAQFLSDVLSHCEGAAQNLECVQAETVAFVLDAQGLQAQVLSHLLQVCQRSDAVLREAFVESTCLGNVLQSHDFQLVTIALGHGIQFPFHLGFHVFAS